MKNRTNEEANEREKIMGSKVIETTEKMIRFVYTSVEQLQELP
jgi:hypothetical protein